MNNSEKLALRNMRAIILHRFSLKDDKADDQAIDQELRAGIEMKGTNLWVLMFAIFVASIGLNVNSTAVIIGAMLISPLMGPIMGIGYGVGILDFPLIRSALKNLGIAMLIALLTSSIYFFFSPLTSAQSELMARTTPTIWDVLIALFGGFAGVIGATRKDKSNVIPGVAIATALMPPLCTAGFGLANGNWPFFFGAFYLFTINCVFIAFSSAIVIRALHVREKRLIDEQGAKRVRKYVAAVVVLTVLPSLYLAYMLVQEEVFKARANRFVGQEFNLKQSHIIETQVDPKEKRIVVTLIGEFIPQDKLANISDRLSSTGLAEAKLEVHQTDQRHVDVTSLKTGLLSDLYTKSQISLENKDKTIRRLQDALNAQKNSHDQLKMVPAELYVLFPQINEIWLSEALVWDQSSGIKSQPTAVLNLSVSQPLKKKDQAKIEQWLLMRIQAEHVKLVVEPVSINKLAKSSDMNANVATKTLSSKYANSPLKKTSIAAANPS